MPVGYAVEIAALIDTACLHGAGAIAQVDLGTRGHSHQNLFDLGLMATQLLAASGRRLALYGEGESLSEAAPPSSVALTQWARGESGEIEPNERSVWTLERPPARFIGPAQ